MNARVKQCATADAVGTQVMLEPCSALNLNQRWSWDPQTSQILNAGTLTCAASTAVRKPIVTQACNNSPGQMWLARQAFTDEKGQRITNVNPYPNFPDQGWARDIYRETDGIILDWTTEPDNNFAFTFPLL